ncbi:MAG: methyltransferase family protein [Thermoplasmata archaeon]
MAKKTNVLGIGHIMALTMGSLAILLGFINVYFFKNWVLQGKIFPIIGTVLVLIGIILVFFSVKHLQQAFKYGKLVTDGPYAYVRNPLYAGWILFIIPGIILIFGLILLIPVPFLTYGLFRKLIKKEEKYLEEKFGNEYIEYRKRVNLLIPKIKK